MFVTCEARLPHLREALPENSSRSCEKSFLRPDNAQAGSAVPDLAFSRIPMTLPKAPDGKETKRLQKRTDDGLCISCPKPLDGKGRKCSSCRKRETTLVQERDRKGICHNCANPALPGRTQCAEHVAKQEISNHEAYIKRKASGKCVLCSKGPAVEGKTRCQPCFDKYAAKSTKCLVEQVCYGCGTSSDNGCLHCDDCLEARRQVSQLISRSLSPASAATLLIFRICAKRRLSRLQPKRHLTSAFRNSLSRRACLRPVSRSSKPSI